MINKFQRRIDREGHQIVPLLTELWKKSETTGYMGGSSQLDIRKIYQRLENFDYNGVMELCSDVQLMLKSAIQYYGFSHEVCLLDLTVCLHVVAEIILGLFAFVFRNNIGS